VAFARRGRKIGLEVLVLPAMGEAKNSRAQYDLEGGPGPRSRAVFDEPDAGAVDLSCFAGMKPVTADNTP